MLVTRLGISNTRFLYSIKAVMASNLDSIRVGDIIGNIAKLLAKIDIMLYKLISFILNIDTFD